MKRSTSCLCLRPIQSEDAPQIFAYRQDRDTNKYQGWIPETIADVEAWIAKTVSTVMQPDTWFQLVIIHTEDNMIIGDIGLHFLDEYQAEVGITLDKTYHHQGLASEALVDAVDYLFTDLKLHRITASIDPANTASIALMERLGFRKEAHFVQSLLIDGEWVDDVIYAKLRASY